MQNDIQDVSEKEFAKLYAEYQATLGRPVVAVVHRQGRNIPGCVTARLLRLGELARGGAGLGAAGSLG